MYISKRGKLNQKFQDYVTCVDNVTPEYWQWQYIIHKLKKYTDRATTKNRYIW